MTTNSQSKQLFLKLDIIVMRLYEKGALLW